MNTADNLQLILAGGVLGILGQGARVLIGLKKLREETGGSEEAYEKSFSANRIFLTLFIGFVTGGMAALAMFTNIDQKNAYTLIGIGYLGVDFIEGLFLRKIAPSIPLDVVRAQISNGTQPLVVTAGSNGQVTSSDIDRIIENRLELLRKERDNVAIQPTNVNVPLVDFSHAAVVDFSLKLSGSVGQNALNNPGDVRALKMRFHELGFNWTPNNEIVDPNLVGIINLFQSIIAGDDSIATSRDGIVSVPGPINGAYRWLQANNAPRWSQLGPGSNLDRSVGYFNYTLLQNDGGQYGTNWLIDTIEEAGRLYYQNYLKDHPNAAVMQVNDLSRISGQAFPPHLGHRTGIVADIRLPKKNGDSGGITWQDTTNYDREATRAMMQSLLQTNRIKTILFNDEVLINEGLCRFANKHNDHFHVEIKIPARQVEFV